MPGIIVTDSIQLAAGGTSGVGAAEIADGSITDVEVAAANKDGAAGTASMRTLGTGAQQACAGNDARLTDSRPPNGAAGGDLGGTYPNPEVDIVDSDVLGSGTPSAGTFLRGDRTWAAPSVAAAVTVKEQGGAGPFTRGTLNLIEGSNVTIAVADDAGNDEVDVTIASTGGSGAALVATTIAGLPDAPDDGQTALLRAGSTPFELIPLIYDDTYGKWVSGPLMLPLTQISATFTTTSTSYAAVGSDVSRPRLINFKALWDAGLRPQVSLVGTLTNSSGANTTFARLGLDEFNDGDTSLTNILNAAEISVATATFTVKASGWTDVTGSAPSDNHIEFRVYVKVSAGTGTYANLSGQLRWVADPA